VLSGLSQADLQALEWSWEFWRQAHQTPPPPPWRVWALIAGRGAGKSWTGAQWVRSEIESGNRRCIALVAPTHLAGRKVMIEDGLLRLCPPWAQPIYEMTTGVVRWPNGGVCHLLSSETPDRARGFNFDGAWCDETGTWENADEAWDQLSFATRLAGPLGASPAIVVTTTPKPTKLMRRILADPGTVVTRATTFDNRAYLDPAVLEHLRARYQSTRLGRQELLGELLEDIEGARCSHALLDAHRVAEAPAQLRRVVVAVDPSGRSKGAETGIIAAGFSPNGHIYVLGNHSLRAGPERWGRAAVATYEVHRADRIVAERNFGGDMVASVIRSVDSQRCKFWWLSLSRR
jgi:phage terminase large subunit-like protein